SGCWPLLRSTMLRRRCASAALSSQCRPASSGPRYAMMSRMRAARTGASASSRSTATIPAIPHIVLCRLARAARPVLDAPGPASRHVVDRQVAAQVGVAIDELSEPQLQHQEAPQPVPMVLLSVAV